MFALRIAALAAIFAVAVSIPIPQGASDTEASVGWIFSVIHRCRLRDE